MSSDSNGPVQVEYRQLGKTGLRVSVPILGAMGFGDPSWNSWVLPEDKSHDVLKAAWDRGINTIDTANIYSNGASERVIGTFMKKYNIKREKLVILTKVLGVVAEEVSLKTHLFPGLDKTRDYINQSGLSRTAIFNAVDASLARLGTSYIDLLQIHRFDPTTPVEETMKALNDLIVCGKVRYIGASSMRAWQFAHMNHVADKHGWTQFVSMQSEYSLMYREEEKEMYAYCNFHGIGIIPWAPMCAGHLARPLGSETPRTTAVKGTILEKKYRESDRKIINRVEEVAAKRGWTMSQVALSWVASKATSPIVGANSETRVEESVLRGKILTDDELKYLEEPYEIQPTRGFA